MNRLEKIRWKLDVLRSRDRELRIFGAWSHEYNLNPPITEEQVRDFERSYNITLPEEYCLFLLELGNGGAGPYYGLTPLQDTVELIDPNRLAEPFPLAKWLEAFKACTNPTQGQADHEEHFERLKVDSKHDKQIFVCMGDHGWPPYPAEGALRICEMGGMITLDLIVTGEGRGQVWVNDAAYLAPLSYPGDVQTATGFLDLYENWIDASLKELADGAPNRTIDEVGWFAFGNRDIKRSEQHD